MSSNGEFLFISRNFEGRGGLERKELFMNQLREKLGTYHSGTNLMIYPPHETKYGELPVLQLAHDCPIFERLLSYNNKNRAQIFIEQIEEIYKIAVYNDVDVYYTSEYTELYTLVDIIEAFTNGEMLKINGQLIDQWQKEVNAINE